MKSSIAAAVLGLFAVASALAGPIEARSKDDTAAAVLAKAIEVDKRNIIFVYICLNVNFQGACMNFQFNTGQCCRFSTSIDFFESSFSSLLWTESTRIIH